MDVVFADAAHTDNKNEVVSITCHWDQLLTTLRTAAHRATQSGHSVLASFVQPLERWNAIDIFSASTQAAMGECFFWERPSEQTALVGIGTATTVETTGRTHITAAITPWRTLLQHAVINHTRAEKATSSSGPLFFGGFAFDPLSPRTNLWAGFPDGLLILPRLLISSNTTDTTLTINSMVQADENIEHRAQEIIASLAHLYTTAKKLSVQSQPPTTKEPAPLCLHDLRPASEWMKLVTETAHSIQKGSYEKVVLARGVEVTSQTSEKNFDGGAILRRLRQIYPSAYIFALQRGDRYFIGATPERLICAQHGQIQTIALAGSAPRGATIAEDQQLGAELLHNPKNKNEHQIVVKMIQATLTKLCSKVWVADAPHLRKLKNVQHLETPIVGKLLAGRCILEAIAALHPTPAVAGFPRRPALKAIRTGEQLDRGWYAGPIGWLDASGNAEFAVALRSALIEKHKATLFAGCGIMADSDPQSEYAESYLKLQVMLRGLGEDN
ncbi:MAG: isochorismate synthase [Ktedonobacteraceae bacterium]